MGKAKQVGLSGKRLDRINEMLERKYMLGRERFRAA